MFDFGKNNKGFATLIMIIILTGLVLIITFSLTNIIITKARIGKNLVLSAQSYYSAESGVEDGLIRVINNYSYILGLNSFNLDGAFVDLYITKNGNETTVESLSDFSNNERKVRTSLVITSDDISFHYGVQVGPGGLNMENNSEIEGNIYSDGTITGVKADITGDVFVAAGMNLDRAWTDYNSNEDFGKSSPVLDIAQSFSPTTSDSLTQVSFYIKKSGTPADRTIYIVDDNGGSPAKTFGGGAPPSAILETSKITGSYGWVDYSFSSPPSLTGGQTYWIIIDTSEDSTDYFTIGRDLLKGNTNGVSKYSAEWDAGSPAWTEDDGDFDFKAWMGGGAATSLDGVDVGGNVHAHNIINSDITGDAYYQTISNSKVGGFPCPNAKCHPGSPDPAVEALPISDSNIADWKNDAAGINPSLNASLCKQPVSVTINGGVLDCTSEIDGAFSPTNGIIITLNGTLWVKGDITLGVGTKVILGSGYGSKSGIIIADNPGNESTSGKILTDNLVVICGSQGLDPTDDKKCATSIGSYILMLSTHSGAATYAINVRNNTNGAIFYAHAGTAHINNGANLKEVTAYRLELAQTAIVKYESGLASASFTSGPGAGWRIDNWNEFE